MELLLLFLKGLMLGGAIAAPVGPVGVLCVSRTLERGRLVGLVSGLGAASADTIYAALASAGITPITDFLQGYRGVMAVVGAAVLIGLGIGGIITNRGADCKVRNGRGLFGAYTSTLVITLSNPMTLVAFLAVFGGLAVAAAPGWGWWGAASLTAGVFLGSAVWWLGLALLAGLVRGGVSERLMKNLKIGVGVFLVIMGLVVLFQGLADAWPNLRPG